MVANRSSLVETRDRNTPYGSRFSSHGYYSHWRYNPQTPPPGPQCPSEVPAFDRIGEIRSPRYNDPRDSGGALLALRISVIATVKNEGSSINRLLQSLRSQTRPPDEVIIVDGGSTDGTADQLLEWEKSHRLPLRVLIEPGSNISRGRNVAIRAARGPVIASTDAGVRLEASWLDHLSRPFDDKAVEPAPVVACGFFVPVADTAFEVAMGATILPALSDIKAESFLPSSRSVAYPKSAWEAAGGYPEWLDYCEDVILDLRLRSMGYQFVFVPDAVAHFRPRGSLRSFFAQYYRYARGDGKADLWPERHTARYLTYLGAVPVLTWLSICECILWGLPLLVGAAIMLWTPYKRLLPTIQPLRALDRLKAILWVPIIRLTGDVAKMLGYPVGRWWRLRHSREIPRWRD